MTTWTALTTLGDKERAEGLGEALEGLTPEPTGVGVFSVEDGSGLWEVGGYFVEAPDEVALALLAAAHDARPFAISKLPETDWVAEVKRELAPIEAGRFFLYGSHDADRVPDDVVGLLIEAAMAFGTGHHGTTKGCLLAFENLIEAGHKPTKIIDVGCGTAVLAMAAAKIWDAEIWASDIDEVATDVALANIKVNDLAGQIEVVTAPGLDAPELRNAAPYDLIFANILKGPLIELAPDLAGATSAGGHLILSGILAHQTDELIAAYEAQGCAFVDRVSLGDWDAVTMRKAG